MAKKIETKKLQIWGRAQREAARGRKSDSGDILGVESLLLRTPPGECNCISLHRTRSVHFGWVDISHVNYVVSGPKFTSWMIVWSVDWQVADSFDDRSIEARFAKVVQSASEGSNGIGPGAPGQHGRTSRPRPQLSTTSADPGTTSGNSRYQRPGAAADASNDSPSRHLVTDSSGTAGTAASGSAASRTKRPRPKLSSSEIWPMFSMR